MLCRKCGKQVPDDAKYCDSCGAKLQPAQTAEPEKPSGANGSDVVTEVKSTAKETAALFGSGWKKLMRWLYVRLSGMEPESEPTVFDVCVALKDFVLQLSKKQRIVFLAGSAAVLLVLVCLVGTLVTPNRGNSGGGSSGGGGSWSGGSHFYQPEFSKPDCLTCGGDGDCNTCGGYGEVRRYAGAGDTVRSKCSSCYGSGNCRTCGGSGKR